MCSITDNFQFSITNNLHHKYTTTSSSDFSLREQVVLLWRIVQCRRKHNIMFTLCSPITVLLNQSDRLLRTDWSDWIDWSDWMGWSYWTDGSKRPTWRLVNCIFRFVCAIKLVQFWRRISCCSWTYHPGWCVLLRSRGTRWPFSQGTSKPSKWFTWSVQVRD